MKQHAAENNCRNSFSAAAAQSGNAWEVLDLSTHGFIEASAGTGKTYTIERLVCRILARPEETPWKRPVGLDEILIVTYTEKAAAELRGRIRAVIEQMLSALDGRQAGDADITALINAGRGDAAALQNHLERCLTQFDRAAIHTIHSFCNRYLGAYAFESGRTVDAEIGDAQEVARRAARAVARSSVREMEVRGPGTVAGLLEAWGLTAGTLIELLAQIAGAWNPSRGDAILPNVNEQDFAAALRSFHNRFCTGSPETHPFVKNFNADSLKNGLRLARRPQAPWIEERAAFIRLLLSMPAVQDSASFSAWIQQRWNDKKDKQYNGLAGFFITSSRTFEEMSPVVGEKDGASFDEFIRGIETLRSLASHVRYQPLMDLIAKTHEKLAEFKQRSNLVTYDDIIASMHAALGCGKTSAGGGQIPPLLALLRRQFRYGIIDEFQDTNRMQWDIFRRIFMDDNEGRPADERGCMYVVGDPKQSIFSFQGADVTVYMRALRDIRLSSVNSRNVGIRLDRNFRSSPEMISAHNAIFSMEDWFVWEDAGDDIEPPRYHNVGAGKPANSPCYTRDSGWPQAAVVLRRLYAGGGEGDGDGTKDGNKSVKAHRLASWITSWICHLTGRDDDGETPMKMPERDGIVRLSDVCILVEKHAEAIPVMQCLRQSGIPFSKQRNDGLFRSEECLYLMAVLDAIDKPENPKAIRAAFLTPFFGHTADEFAENEDLFGEYWRADMGMLRAWSVPARRCEWGRMFGAIYRESGIFARVGCEDDGKLRVAALRQLRSYCLRELIDKHLTLAQCIVRLRSLYAGSIKEAEEEDIFHRETDGDAVQILTMHSAKGLEFPVVFIAGGAGENRRDQRYLALRNGRGGTDFWIGTGAGKQLFERQRDCEQRRLYYVAMTRAKYRLFVPVWDNPRSNKAKNSASCRFLSRCLEQAAARLSDPSLIAFDTRPMSGSAAAYRGGAAAAVPAEEIIGDFDRRSAQIGQHPPLARTTVRLSYSSMTRLAERFGVRITGGSDERHETPLDAQEEEELRNEILPPGAVSGEALHAIFETADFGHWARLDSAACAHEDPACRETVERCLTQFGLLAGDASDEKRIRCAAGYAWNSLKAAAVDPFPGASVPIVLGEIERRQRMAEVEFHFVFGRDGAPFNAGSRAAGWVRGFVDLVFEHEGRYYILDWKSNWLAGKDYSAEKITADMELHRYDVQYKVYACALDHWLGRKLGAAYDRANHFGGVMYFYVRGTQAGRGDTGVWAQRPSDEQLQTEWPAFLRQQIYASTRRLS